jgi:hypothetical protein
MEVMLLLEKLANRWSGELHFPRIFFRPGDRRWVVERVHRHEERPSCLWANSNLYSALARAELRTRPEDPPTKAPFRNAEWAVKQIEDILERIE